jgi:TP901 family phage tail tape measure protein
MSDFEKVYSIKFDVSKADSALEKLEKALSKIEKSGVFFQLQAISKTLVEVERNADKASKTIQNQMGRQARRDLNELGKAGKKAADGIEHIPRAANRANISLSQIGRNLNRYVLAPMAALGGLSIKAAFDINKGMANVSTLVEKTPEQLLEMKRQAQDTMVAMGKGTQDVTDGLYQVISALGESDQNMGQLEKSTKAAVAGLSDTKSSVEMLTAVAKAYNDTSAKSIEHTSDLAFQTVKLGVTTFPELAASIGKVAPLAAQFNTSQEELFGTMATLTGVTGNTTEVVTQLASIYGAFMNPSEEMDKALKKINRDHEEYNFTTIQSMVKTLGFKESIELLGKEAGGSEEKLFAMFRRKEAILGILPLISSQSDNYTKKIAAMGKAAGATDEAFRKQTEGINAAGFQMEQAKQRVVVLAQRFGDKLLPMLVKVIDAGERFADWLETVDEDSIETAISIGKIVAQTVLFVNALRALYSVGNGITAFFGFINPAFGTFSTQIGSATGKVDVFAKSLSGLQKTVSILGALALGYTIGDLINEGIIEPARRKEQKKRSKIVSRGVEATLHPGRMTDDQLDYEQKKLQGDLESFNAGNDAAGRRIGLNPAVSRFFTSQTELDEREMIIKTAEEGIGSIEQEKRRRATGLHAIEQYEQEKERTLNYFDPTIVRNEQVRQATRAGIAGGSYPDSTALQNAIGFGEEAARIYNINTDVTVNRGESNEAVSRRVQRELARKLMAAEK